LFPNITSLNWLEKKNSEYQHFNQFPIIPQEFINALTKWKHLKRVVDYQNHVFLNIPNNLLVQPFTNLKYPQVTLDDYSCGEYGQRFRAPDMLDALLKNIHNTPSIEHIRFSKTAIKSMDVEKLHAGLPKLKEIILEVHIYILKMV
jgi:hypothetical protein